MKLAEPVKNDRQGFLAWIPTSPTRICEKKSPITNFAYRLETGWAVEDLGLKERCSN